MGSNKRISYLDVIKGIGMLLVVMGHCIETTNAAKMIIHSFHMPLFFMVSGFLYRPRESKDYFVSKVKALVVPAIIFDLINEILYLFLFLLHKRSYANFISFGAIWFLKSLFLTTVTYYIMDTVALGKCKSEKTKKTLLMPASGLLFIVSHVYYIKMNGQQNYYNSALGGLFFFSLGYVAGPLLNRITDNANKNNPAKIIALTIGILLICVLGYSAPKNGMVSMNLACYKNPVKFVINALIGVTAIWLIASVINKNKFLEYLGRNSLMIYILHRLPYKCIAVALTHFKITGIAQTGINFVLTLTAALAGVYIINRWFPFLAGRINYDKFLRQSDKQQY